MKPKARFVLKRQVVIVGLLLLLAAVIGFESMDFRKSGNPDAAMREVPEIPRSMRRDDDASVDIQRSGSPTRALAPLPSEGLPELSAEIRDLAEIRRDAGSAAARRVPSSIYYINSHSVLRGRVENQSLSGAIEMLQRAVAKVSSTLPPDAVVLDMEGLGSSHARFVVYGNQRYNLSEEVAAAFEELQLQHRKPTEGGQTGR